MSMRRQQFLIFRIYQFRDTKAYGELYDQYYDKIRRYIYFKMPNAEETDEITAEVFLRGWEYATSSRVDNPSALFYKIARNLIADFYRTRKQLTSLDVVEEIEGSTALEKEIEIKHEHEVLVEKIMQLREEYREVLVMRFLNEMSIGEIADALEKTSNNVRVLLHRAKNALQEIAPER